ncbi:MAG: Ldh family oxidoreductase [Parafilimonas sp.]
MPQTFPYHTLYYFTHSIFLHIGCSHKDAETATKALLAADLRGIDSHGIGRLNG